MSEQPLDNPSFSNPALSVPEREFGVEQAMKLVDALQVEQVDHVADSELSTSADEIIAAFQKSQKIIDSIKLDDHFQGQLIQAGIHPYKDAAKQPYWNVLANYVSGRLATKDRVDATDVLQLGTLELLASTPAFLLAQTALDEGIRIGPDKESNKVIASKYNGYVRQLADQFPELTASELRRQLLEATQATMSRNAPHPEIVVEQISKCIRGAQHETAFGQLLAGTGLTYRPSPVEKDLKGSDYEVIIAGNELDVDVKASLHDVSAKRSEGPYAIKDGKVIMYSLIDDHELHDGFHVSAETTARKAPIARQLLEEAAQKIYRGPAYTPVAQAI